VVLIYSKGCMKKKLIRILALVGFLPLVFLLFLLYSTVFEYRPGDMIPICSSGQSDTLHNTDVFSTMTWNLGYAGLGEHMDFFYDGGKNVRDTHENVIRNLDSITSFVVKNDSIDFILVQEIDFRSRRSYRMDQFSKLDSLLNSHYGFFGINYKVDFVPVPVFSPMGKVRSGIATYCTYMPKTVDRYAFHGDYSWPKRIFMLKRCYLVCRYPMANGKEFILINTHNSAYDDGSLRKEQLRELERFSLDEFKKGNYVLIGGDWNQSPSGFEAEYDHVFDTVDVAYLPESFLQGWQQLYSTKCPTNRRVMTSYNPITTPTTVIDFYIASPNIIPVSLHVIDLKFKNSDHQPVLLSFAFK
jgi:endonuclease/exonuclease/phosphatase family metal-dependent hydrolase